MTLQMALFKIVCCLNTLRFAAYFKHVNYVLGQIEVSGTVNRHTFLPYLLEKTCSGLREYSV